jgi:predicted metalloprotease with PDZ domain
MRAFVAIIAAVLMTAAATAGETRYTLSPVIEQGALRAIAVELVLNGEADGETEIELPGEWGGKSELWRGIQDFRVSGQGMRLASGQTPALKLIRHEPGATLTIRYRVSQFWEGEPTASGSNEYRPVIRPGYFQLIGWTAMARPRWSLATPVTVAFKDFPNNWGFASDLEHRQGRLELVDVLESVTVGGDFRVVKAGALRVAIRGVWSFSDEGFLRRLEPIIASHHRFWGDEPTPFLVTVMPLLSPTGIMSLGGTGLSDAFAFFATDNVGDEPLTRILAHEHLHSWIPRRVGMMPQDNDKVDYWFSEGFTDFYTHRLLARDGLWSVEQIAKAFNEIMWAYGFSPARNASNATVAAKFWQERAMNDLPYQRGFLFAARADHLLRQATKGARDLDDVMAAMKRVVDAVPHGAPPPPVRALFIRTMKEAGLDIEDDIARFIERGETLILPADVWAACGIVATGEIAEFDRGFDGERTIAAENVVTGVNADGPAFAAGLREGMRLKKLDLSESGDARARLSYQVLADGGTQEISYLPAGKRKQPVQELALRPMTDAAARKACAARLGGTD